MRIANWIAFIAVLALSLSVAGAQSSKKNKKADTQAAADHLTDPNALADPKSGGPGTGVRNFVIGAEDIIRITVIASSTQPSVNDYAVRPDGYISVPLIGEVMAAGITPSKLESVIAQKFVDGKMYVEPNVTVSVVQFNSRKVYISGEGIAKPGTYPLIVPTKVSELIAQAGGFRDFAKVTKIRIVRGGKSYYYNDKEVSHGKKMDQDILLEPGDHIYVDA